MIAYQVELLSNSLFYKLTKSIAELGNKVIAIGVKREIKSSSGKIEEVDFSESMKLHNVSYLEIPVNISYARGLRNFLGVLSYQSKVMREVMKRVKDIDVLYAIDFLMAIPLATISLMKRKRFIYHIADNFVDAYKVPRILKPFFLMIDKLLVNIASAIVIPDETRITKYLEKHRHKMYIIYNSPEDIFNQVDIHERKNDQSKGTLRIAYFGVLTEDRFLKELCKTVTEIGSLELHIGGFGPLESYISEQAKHCERIKFYGKIPYTKVLDIQKDADLLIAMYDPSVANNRRSSPNKLFEAMMLSKPIIVSKGMGVENFVISNNIGFVSEYSIQSFNHLIRSILENKSILDSLGRNGRKLYETNYSWDKMKEKIAIII